MIVKPDPKRFYYRLAWINLILLAIGFVAYQTQYEAMLTVMILASAYMFYGRWEAKNPKSIEFNLEAKRLNLDYGDGEVDQFPLDLFEVNIEQRVGSRGRKYQVFAISKDGELIKEINPGHGGYRLDDLQLICHNVSKLKAKADV